MKIFCRNCGNQKDFTLGKETEVEFDHVRGEWGKETTTSPGIIVCKYCDADENLGDIVVEK